MYNEASDWMNQELYSARVPIVKTYKRMGDIEILEEAFSAIVDMTHPNLEGRGIKEGLPAFQVGPTCYRGLWIVDGAFLLEAAAMLGAGDQARSGVAYELTLQKADGRMESLTPDYWKENGMRLAFGTISPHFTDMPGFGRAY